MFGTIIRTARCATASRKQCHPCFLGKSTASAKQWHTGRGPTGFRRRSVGLGIVSCMVVAAVAVGCGGKKGCERALVSGTVIFQGQPVASGRIRFVPIKGTQAPISGAEIVDGKYSVEAGGGVPVGTHKIEITARHSDPESRELARSLMPNDPGYRPPPPQYIPRKYNVRTELEITIPSGSHKITKDFSLTN